MVHSNSFHYLAKMLHVTFLQGNETNLNAP